MTPSVDDNTKYRCLECGAIYDFPSLLAIKPCLNCGLIHYDSIRITTVCDFCAVPITGEAWTFPCQDFKAPDLPGLPVTIVVAQLKRGDWCCCDECKPLVEAQDWSAIVSRMGEVAGWSDAPNASLHAKRLLPLVTALWEAFVANRTGLPYRELPDDHVE